MIGISDSDAMDVAAESEGILGNAPADPSRTTEWRREAASERRAMQEIGCSCREFRVALTRTGRRRCAAKKEYSL